MLWDLPRALSSFASDIDRHMALIYWICGIWFLVAEAVLLWLAVRYRQSAHAAAGWLPGDTRSTNAWVLVPAALVLVCDMVIEFDSAVVWAKVKETTPPAELTVRVQGRQFAWVFTYPGPDAKFDTLDDITAAGTLRVPVGKVVKFELEAADVLHAFYVPELRLKQDAVPGRRIPGWFDVLQPAELTIACAELCGASHTYMKGTLLALPPAEFDQWLAAQSAPPPSTPPTATR
ncbi:MAG: cytochrome c oxidase subunit II [Deltaproteobacteria bacterium]|nr:cytochrome c oxidase subunit II [Deltaproteobacteria bacterium]